MNLQVALILIGLVVLVLIIIVSFWKDRFGGLFSRRGGGGLGGGGLISTREFVLGDSEKAEPQAENVEPTLDRMDEQDADDDSFDDFFFDAGSDDTGDGPHQLTIGESMARRSAGAEEADDEAFAEESYESVRQLDYWVKIVGSDPVERDRILSVYRQQEYLLEHEHSIHGRIAPSGEWRNIESEDETATFMDVVLTIQLADRNGPVNSSEMTRFNNLVFSLSENLDRKFKYQSTTEEAMAQAERLEQFCEDFDVLAIINICAEGDRKFRGPEVLRAVEGSGMRYGDLKVFHGPEGASGEALYSIANMVKPGAFELDRMQDFTTPGLTIYMNVPRCPNPGDVFSRMAYVAGKIATNLGGVMKDQNNHVLDDRAVHQIRRQVEELGQKMTEKGMKPGSDEALRLF